MKARMKVFSSWSGGKESCLACYKALSDGFDVSYLLNFVSEDGTRSRAHGISSDLIALQADAIGIPIIQVKSSWEDYEAKFKDGNWLLDISEYGLSEKAFTREANVTK